MSGGSYGVFPECSSVDQGRRKWGKARVALVICTSSTTEFHFSCSGGQFTSIGQFYHNGALMMIALFAAKYYFTAQRTPDATFWPTQQRSEPAAARIKSLRESRRWLWALTPAAPQKRTRAAVIVSMQWLSDVKVGKMRQTRLPILVIASIPHPLMTPAEFYFIAWNYSFYFSRSAYDPRFLLLSLLISH